MKGTTAKNTFRFHWNRTKCKEDKYELHNETNAVGNGGEEEMVSSLIIKYKLSDARSQGRAWRDPQVTEAWKASRKLTIGLLGTDTG